VRPRIVSFWMTRLIGRSGGRERINGLSLNGARTE
jgi:hypothetical protein